MANPLDQYNDYAFPRLNGQYSLSTGGNQAPVPAPTTATPGTGGNQQPSTTYPPTGGNQPPVPATTYPSTGGNQQSLPYTPPVPPTVATSPPPLGGNQQPIPATPAVPGTGGNQAPVPYNTGIVPPHLQTGGNQQPEQVQNPGNFGPVQTVQKALDSFINGQYAQNARLRGKEFANQRGLLNSSIAAGAAERAALESVQPFVNESMNLLNNREDRALRQQLQNDAVLQQDWLQSRQFANQFNANLSMLPVTTAIDMLKSLTQYALQEPEVYTPEIMSGYTTFFNNNMLSLLKQYFPNSVQGG